MAMAKKALSSMSDDELKSLYNYNDSKVYTSVEISNEVSKRINECAPIVGTNKKLDAIDAIAKDYSFDRFLNTPYSCMIDGKRVWFKSLGEMYYTLTKDDSWYKQDHKHFIESEWWLGKSRPTPYKEWLKSIGVNFIK